MVCSDSSEETVADNSETVIIPIQYATEIILSRSDYIINTPRLLNVLHISGKLENSETSFSFRQNQLKKSNGLLKIMHNPENGKRLFFFLNRKTNMDVDLLNEKDEITNPIKTYSDIGPELKFNLKVSAFIFLIFLNNSPKFSPIYNQTESKMCRNQLIS